uniref:GCK domain-containing protein n=2 Tax=Chenopodium quinoa TaxID=63459 RepID=A0A803L1U4_CHEQI
MKGGGCKDEFVAWEKCVEDAEKNQEDIVEKCFEVTGNLKNCMIAHSDYYEPILRAEKAAEEEVKQEMDREAAAKSDEQGSDSKAVEGRAEIEVQKEN